MDLVTRITFLVPRNFFLGKLKSRISEVIYPSSPYLLIKYLLEEKSNPNFSKANLKVSLKHYEEFLQGFIRGFSNMIKF